MVNFENNSTLGHKKPASEQSIYNLVTLLIKFEQIVQFKNSRFSFSKLLIVVRVKFYIRLTSH